MKLQASLEEHQKLCLQHKRKWREINIVNMNSLTRPLSILRYPPSLRPILAARLYATETGLGTSNASSRPRRKAVTAFNDDGRVPWGELTGKKKAARATQQTFNFSFIILGAILTVSLDENESLTMANIVQGGVAYFMYTEVFSLDSKTSHFNRAFDQLRKDSRCTELLGNSKKITAYGEPTWNKWRRARPIA
jgi:mitochondrial import inner membrane translocase subunit TIM21